jgi:hypothetical protein
MSKVVEAIKNILSKRVLTILAVIFMIFLTSGGVYLIVIQPGGSVATSTGSSFLARSSQSQTSIEFLVTFFLTAAGVVGFLLLEGALKRSFDLHGSRMRYLMALVLIALSVGLMEYLFYVKSH